MADFGMTPEGFSRPTQQDLLTEIADDLHTDLDPQLDTGTKSPHGQHNGVTSRQAAFAWEVLAACHDQMDPDLAEDAQLIAICKLTGTVPQAATASEVICLCTLDTGATLVPDDALAAVNGRPDILFTPKESFTAPSPGVYGINFRCLTLGPIAVAAGQLSVIHTPTVVGWRAVGNPTDATPGRAADTNETLRARREAELAKAGSATARAIRADLLAIEVNGVRNVQNAIVLENDTDALDANSVPPHSIECIVYDSPTISNLTIGQTILDSKAGAIRAHGQIASGVTDDSGHPIKFSRPTARDVWLTYDLTTEPGFDADAFKSAVVAALTAAHTVNDDVLRWTGEQVAKLPGVVNVLSLKLGFSVSPTLSNDLVIGSREIAAFSTTRVVIT